MMKANNKRIAFFIVAFLGLLVSSGIPACKQDNVSLGDQVTLEGTVITRTVWGPPNFGEEPKTDSKGEVFVLLLKHKIRINGNHFASDEETKKGGNKISELQLNGDRKVLGSYERKKVQVVGIVNEATAPMEQLPFVLEVKEITLRV